MSSVCNIVIFSFKVGKSAMYNLLFYWLIF
jgi:hypothetical protein